MSYVLWPLWFRREDSQKSQLWPYCLLIMFSNSLLKKEVFRLSNLSIQTWSSNKTQHINKKLYCSPTCMPKEVNEEKSLILSTTRLTVSILLWRRQKIFMRIMHIGSCWSQVYKTRSRILFGKKIFNIINKVPIKDIGEFKINIKVIWFCKKWVIE